uniref:Bromo domain-containing protein n=1 Tax=Noccaea caerulescens TaxID=107243 RepID=A0A1J3F826_NOCCA
MTKEEEARSYSMNDDNDTVNNDNNYIRSDDYNNNDNIVDDDDDNTNLNKHKSQAWGTWEELLLACAVKRHGFGDWDSVATEVRSRSSISAVFVSANNCKQKYRDLKRRFQESAGGESDAAAEEGGDEERIGNIPWLEQLRSLRVAELRREVQQYDVSILSLQLKVKKLEEEREGDQKPDLDDERKGERSGNDGSESKLREKAVSTAEESDRENRSMNESNSTTSGGKTAGENERVVVDEPGQVRDDSGDNNPNPDPVYKAEAMEEGSVSRGSEVSHSDELGESGTSGKKWKQKRRKRSGGSKNNYREGDGEIRSAVSKSQPLIGLIDLIRSHPRGSLFERRLRSQDAKDYKSLVKQHLDIETIHRKLKKGSYDSSSVSFYRDLQLLFTNAIIFFPSSSSESMAAHELRTVVSQEMRKETGRSAPRLMNREASAMNSSIKADAETSDSSLSRPKSSGPLASCKRKSLVSAKASPSSSSLSQKEETKEETLSEEKENIVTGARSSRRSSKAVAAAAAAAAIANSTKTGKGKNKRKQTELKTNSSNDNTNNSSKQETGKTEKKAVVSSDKKKSVADFLKRLKKNSPQKEAKEQNKSGGSSKKETKTKPRELRSSVGKKKAEVETTPVKRAPGRPQKKTVEAVATATASGKRGRESGSTGKDDKQPKKRSRR